MWKKHFLFLVMFPVLSSIAIAQDESIPIGRIASRSLIEEFDEPLGAAESSSARKLNAIAILLIKNFEGWRSKAYNDPVGFCTIGFGHLIALSNCEKIVLGEFATPLSPIEGESLLLHDTAGARIAVRSLVNVELNDNQFGALSSFVFNVGKANFSKSTLLKRLNESDYDSAASQFRRWIRASGTVLDGLVYRRACEETLFRGALDPDGDGKFERSDCEHLGAAPIAGDILDIGLGESP